MGTTVSTHPGSWPRPFRFDGHGGWCQGGVPTEPEDMVPPLKMNMAPENHWLAEKSLPEGHWQGSC